MSSSHCTSTFPIELCARIIRFKNDVVIHSEFKTMIDGAEWLRERLFDTHSMPTTELNKNAYFVRNYAEIQKKIAEMRRFYRSAGIKTWRDVATFNRKYTIVVDKIKLLLEHVARMDSNHRFYKKILGVSCQLRLHY
jgi:hypothetical protein